MRGEHMSNDPRSPRRPKPASGDPVSDIERFLKEVDRLRRRAADESQRSDQPAEEAAPVQPAPRRRAEPRPVARPKRRPLLDEEPVPVLEVQPVQRSVLRPEPVAFTQPPPAPVAAPPPPLPEAKFAAFTASQPAPQVRRAPAAAQVRTLLQANNLRTAVILREILDKPRCKRRR